MVLAVYALAYADYWHNPDSIEAEKCWQGWALYIVQAQANELPDNISTWTVP